jgi:SAM-dependent methyltransferase
VKGHEGFCPMKEQLSWPFLFGGLMGESLRETEATIPFWDGYAKWYKLWLEHNRYHDKIIDVLTFMIKPWWKVIDIGAGSGILSLPISAIGCDVTALEPSSGMRNLLYKEAFDRGVNWITINGKKWEDIDPSTLQGTDLMIACNSLHLTEIGFEAALKKAFHVGPNHLFLVTELCNDTKLPWWQTGYRMLFSKSYEIESSFAYHHPDEAKEHWAFKKGGRLCPNEEMGIKKQLIFQDDHLWLRDRGRVGLYWWEKDRS